MLGRLKEAASRSGCRRRSDSQMSPCTTAVAVAVSAMTGTLGSASLNRDSLR
jgi:hypothetical protein